MPTDTVIQLAEINILFQQMVMSMLGLDPAAWNAWLANPVGTAPANPFYNCRIEWPTDGAPDWQVTDDVVFIGCREVDNPMNKQRNVKYQPLDDENVNQITDYMRAWAVNFVAYGPNSFDHIRQVKSQMFWPQNHLALAQNNLYMIPDIPAAVRAPELFPVQGGQYFERVDLTITFTEGVEENLAIPFISSAPITVENSDQSVVTNLTVT